MFEKMIEARIGIAIDEVGLIRFQQLCLLIKEKRVVHCQGKFVQQFTGIGDHPDPLADEVLRAGGGEAVAGSLVSVTRDPSGDDEDRPLKMTVTRTELPEPEKGSRHTSPGRVCHPIGRSKTSRGCTEKCL